MEVEFSKSCSHCALRPVLQNTIEELKARERAAKEAGTLIAEGSLYCPGKRRYAIGIGRFLTERCRGVFELPKVDDEALAQEILDISPDVHVRPA